MQSADDITKIFSSNFMDIFVGTEQVEVGGRQGRRHYQEYYVHIVSASCRTRRRKKYSSSQIRKEQFSVRWIVTDFYTTTALAIEMWNQYIRGCEVLSCEVVFIGELLNYHRAIE